MARGAPPLPLSDPAQLAGGVSRLVAAHRAADAREAASKERILAELKRLPDPLSRHAGPVHVTASAVVCGPPGTVLHLHKRLGRWLQPGGHLEDGEDPATASRREAHEETGLAVAHPAGGPVLIHVDVHDAALGHTHLDLRYLLVTDDVECRPQEGESPQVRWFSWDEADAVADVALLGALRRARSLR